MTNTTILVTGARGKTGRRVARDLRATGHEVREGSRTATPAFDLGVRETWAAALEDVTAVYLVPTTGDGAADGPLIDEFLRAARSAGVSRVVLLSARGGADDGSEPTLEAVETSVREHASEWTILRPAWFAQNFDEGMFAPSIASGDVRLPAGEGREAFVDLDDLAAVAARALTQPGHAGQVYELTGPTTLSFGEAIGIIAERTGSGVRYTALEPSAFAEEYRAIGVPDESMALLATLLEPIREGRSDHGTRDIERVLDRPATPFDQYVDRAATNGSWA